MSEEHRNYQLVKLNRRLLFMNLILRRTTVVFAAIAILEFITLIFIHIK